MDLFGFLKRRRRQTDRPAQLPVMLELPFPRPEPRPAASPPLAPDEVRRLLFDAVAAGDEKRLQTLCHEHRDLILTNVAGWNDVPAEIRANRDIFDWYMNGLSAISRYCAEKLAASDVEEGEPAARADAPSAELP